MSEKKIDPMEVLMGHERYVHGQTILKDLLMNKIEEIGAGGMLELGPTKLGELLEDHLRKEVLKSEDLDFLRAFCGSMAVPEVVTHAIKTVALKTLERLLAKA